MWTESLEYFADATVTKPQAYLYTAGLFLCTLVPVLNYHHYVVYISQKFLLVKIGCTLLIQRQLTSLALALLKNSKIIVLDEVTSKIDNETDEVIQAAIKEKFANCTIITIAHRLKSIIESDKILVMEDGKAVEFGHPAELLVQENRKFATLVM